MTKTLCRFSKGEQRYYCMEKALERKVIQL
jgi:hypothetical protein